MNKGSLQIRTGVPGDAKVCVSLLIEFYREIRPWRAPNPVFLEKPCRQLLRDDNDHGCIWLIERNGVVEGVLGATLGTDFFSDEPFAVEEFWYTTRDASPYAALRLIHAFHAWAKERGVSETRLTHVDNGRSPTYIQKMARLYRRLAYWLMEYI